MHTHAMWAGLRVLGVNEQRADLNWSGVPVNAGTCASTEQSWCQRIDATWAVISSGITR